MAVAKDHLLSLGHFTATNRNTFSIPKDHALKKSREMRLQQRWYELRERELMAKQHNKELLQQFDEAQNTLREMLVQAAAMKTIRMEYERYLQENYPHWQQQLKEKTQAAQIKRMEECLKTCLKNSDGQVMKSHTDQPLYSQDLGKMPTNVSAPEEFDSSQDGSSYCRLMRSSWLTQSPSQTALSPNRVPIQPQDLSHVPQSFLHPPLFPHLQPFQLQHLSPTPHHHPLPQQGPPSGWTLHSPDYPWSRAAAGGPSGSKALLGQFFMDEPPLESRVLVKVGEEADASRTVNSKRERGGVNRSGHLSEELDVKPVRLSSGQAESSESSRESSRGSREKRKRRRGSEMNPYRGSHSSQESSQASNAAVIVSAAVSKSSESDVSENSSSRRMRRREGLAVESPKMLKTEQSKKENSGSNNTESESSAEESGSQTEGPTSEKAEAQSPVDKSQSSTEESGSQREELPGKMSMKPENEATGDEEKQESSSSEQSSEEDNDEEDKDHENNPGNEDDPEEKENSPRDEEQDEDDDGEVPATKNLTDEEEVTDAEDEEESDDQEDDEEHSGGEDGRKESSSSQGEDENEGSGEKMEGEGSDEEEERSNKGEVEEERDSDDIIVSPQENRYKKIHVVSEEAAEDDERKEENIIPSSDDEDDGDEGSDEHSEDDDIELLLAPPDETQKKEEMELKVDDINKAVGDIVQRFRAEQKDEPIKSDSDESDHFYD